MCAVVPEATGSGPAHPRAYMPWVSWHTHTWRDYMVVSPDLALCMEQPGKLTHIQMATHDAIYVDLKEKTEWPEAEVLVEPPNTPTEQPQGPRQLKVEWRSVAQHIRAKCDDVNAGRTAAWQMEVDDARIMLGTAMMQ